MNTNQHQSRSIRVTKQPHVFTGPLAVNQRSILKSVQSLLGVNDKRESLADKPITLSELSTVLMTAEMIAMSNLILIDGTLPQKDIERLQAWNDQFHSHTGLQLDIDFLRPDDSAVLTTFCAEAAESASLAMRAVIDNPNSMNEGDSLYKDDPDHPGWFAQIYDDLARARDSTDEQRYRMAREMAYNIMHGKEPYRGAKCVVGMMAAKPLVSVLDVVCAALKSQDSQARRMMGALINRFRINYINALAGLRNAAYMADSSIAELKSAQVLLLWRYIVDKLSSVPCKQSDTSVPEAFDSIVNAAPLGVALLVNSNGYGPRALIEEAFSQRSSVLMKSLAKESPQCRFIHSYELSQSEFELLREEMFREKFRKLNAQNRNTVMSRTARWIRVPPILGGSFGAAAGTVIANYAREYDPNAIAAYSALGASTGYVAGTVLEELLLSIGKMLPEGQLKMRTDAYADLKHYLFKMKEYPEIGSVISDSVRRVFRRELTSDETL